ncbi:aldehyde-activating protein [Aliiroseovarius zhejiangensis]|uniref:Aldehyde-activating protein n=1 Tax=Aliiroseovarius zhejiangensis TaxID=1632025 RepID=A0ABQ3JAL8_9RHOB|nr:GFA family protein [Aliiroseovarius zhejiangensis]GHF07200.1 aldehyde-activating protein [Aliiroseovarius zhejiangensis]
MLQGSCLCGAIRFETAAPPKGVSMCHCGQCRKQSGGLWSSAYVPERELHIEGAVKWFASSQTAKRGFCPTCGSFLFWKAHDEDTISFSLGAIDGPTGLTLEKHIFVADKGDYYDIADGVPQSDT